jgi:hypothetical protein
MKNNKLKLKKKIIRREILKSYFPNPEYISVWYEEDAEVFKSLIKFKEADTTTTLAVWDKENYKCISEIPLTEKTYQEIYKTTAHHQLYSMR